MGDALAGAEENEQIVVTGIDGRFSAQVPPGHATLFLYEPPPGYWIPTNQKFTESVVFGQNQPLVDREYHVRKGTIWNLRFTRGAEGPPHVGSVFGSIRSGFFWAAADNDGQARLTLPSEGGKVTLRVREDTPMGPPTTGFLTLDLEWEPNFRPDEVEEVVRLDGNDRRFRLTDADANSATLQGPDSIQPVKENGRLMIRVALPGRRAGCFGDRRASRRRGWTTDSGCRTSSSRWAMAGPCHRIIFSIRRRQMLRATIGCGKYPAQRSLANL